MEIRLNLKCISKVLPFVCKDKARVPICNVSILDVNIGDGVYRVYETTNGRILARVMEKVEKMEITDRILLCGDDFKKLPKDVWLITAITEIDREKGRAIMFDTIIKMDLESVYPEIKQVLDYKTSFDFPKINRFVYIESHFLKEIELFFNGFGSKKISKGTIAPIIYGATSKGDDCPVLFNKDEFYLLVMPIRK